MDALEALRLQLDWGADEALLATPVNRLLTAAPSPRTGATEVATEIRPAVPSRSAGREAPPPPARAGAGAGPGAGRGPAAGASTAADARALAEASADPNALEAAIRAFDPKGLAATATAMVSAAGDAALGLALVGDTPGADEDRSGTPFGGPAGALLDRMLASIGFARGQVLQAHLLPWRPPGGRPASEAEVATYLPFLQRLLALRRIRWVVLFGTGPARAFLGRDTSLARVRGRWCDIVVPGLPAPIAALPCFAPAQLLDRPELKRQAWADLRLLRRTLDER